MNSNIDNFNAAATAIQRVFRGFNIRSQIRRSNHAATKIQRVFRGFVARRTTKQLLTASRKMQNHDSRLARIQARVTSHELSLARLRAAHHDNLATIDASEVRKAATAIQAAFRGFLARKQYKKRVLRLFKQSSSSSGANKSGKQEKYNEPPVLATADEADIVVAREKVIARLHANSVKYHNHAAGTTKERETAAGLLASLAKCQTLLDRYYDEIEASDFDAQNRLKFDARDVSMGCRALRVRTDGYLDALNACGENLDSSSGKIFEETLLSRGAQEFSRQEHLRSLKDGKMRWWEFDLENYAAFAELMDLSNEDVENSTRTY
ncbi:hypothetical protein HK100_009990 [Physocladia obscura]|uniref:Uncharacterized protein n=1 Tax=Physocladia obscura TaxID=109957 RepID=A0AAD5SM65_9FUNG|nr:hypothetical protein HK100_009990 [Physocladia obscura]